MKLFIPSEVARLQGVIVHTPGHEVSLVNPELKDELLFDDIIFEEDARQEHLDMLSIFRAAMPENGQIFEITDLILEAFQQEQARAFFIEEWIRQQPEKNLHVLESELLKLDPTELLQLAVEGATPALKSFSLNPTPNLLFTRDLAAIIAGNILISRPAREARLRESLLTETVVRFHSLFEGIKENIIQISEQESIEGGDVLVASEKVVLIGMSERTSFSGVMTTAEQLLQNGVEHVLAVDIPKQRSSMHLDTIFTFANHNECVAFPPAITERRDNIVALSSQNGAIQARTISSLKKALEELLQKEFTFINCGGPSRTNQFREQWTDGANIFALAPGIIVGYERNTNTFHELEKHGYQLMNQYEFIEEFDAQHFDPAGKKIAISFMGHELCRGRGGARCMTMPIARKK